MSDIAIKVENLSKKYLIGHGQSGSLRETLTGLWHNTFGGKNPDVEEFWALRDVSFEIKQGEAVGIIGRNGAGKSTLLKLLSKITYPTNGKITMNGRVSSLLEVGTGFHPELTGRENIYLNGTILGMTRREVKSKFDEIVAFSGVERFLDTPVKRYSSGMYVRLAFAVAAHLEPEILIIDEVLAVGDAEFQKKCLGKMDEVAKGGRTVLFVSHNMGAIGDLCKTGILLENGLNSLQGDISKIINGYLNIYKNLNGLNVNDKININRIQIISEDDNEIENVYVNTKFGLRISYTLKVDVEFFTHGINLYNSYGILILSSHDPNKYNIKEKIHANTYSMTIWFPNNFFQPGIYYISFVFMRYQPFEIILNIENMIQLNILESYYNSAKPIDCPKEIPGIIRPLLIWKKS